MLIYLFLFTGTGKTRTIVAIIRALMDCGVRVHATAPTNVAMIILADRTLADATDQCAEYKSKFRLADLLLVASERANIIVEDRLSCLHERPRSKRILDAMFNIGQYIPTFCRGLDGSVSDSEDDEVDFEEIRENMYKSKCRLHVLMDEAPLSLIENCQEFLCSLLSDIEYLCNLNSWRIGDILDEQLQLRVTSIISTLKVVERKLTRLSSDELLKLMFKEASVVFSTVNSGGRRVLMEETFDVVVVDEATQLVQAETAILFRGDMKRLILVGDEHQLPPTVFSKAGVQKGYATSLFARLVALRYPVSMLDVQYRMHPRISSWTSSHIYSNNLSDGANVMDNDYNCGFDSISGGAVTVYDVAFGKEEKDIKGSSYNEAEVEVVRGLMIRVRKSFVGQDKVISVTVLTPYASQCSRCKDICTLLSSANVVFKASTVNSFQGQECDIVIFLQFAPIRMVIYSFWQTSTE